MQNAPYDDSPTIDYNLVVLIFVGGLTFCWRMQFLRALEVIEIMARPERFELPTTWFEATYSFAEFTAELCGFFEMTLLLKTEIQGDKPQ